MRAVAESFTPRARFQSMLDVEAALAEAGACRRHPADGGRANPRASLTPGCYDLSLWAEQTAQDGNPAIPLVRQLRSGRADGRRAAGYVHGAATSQDLLDTSLSCSLRAAVPLVLSHLERAGGGGRRSCAHAYRHRHRRAARWLSAGDADHVRAEGGRMARCDRPRPRGALRRAARSARAAVRRRVGHARQRSATRARASPRARRATARLRVPDMPWHAHRDRLAALAVRLAARDGTLRQDRARYRRSWRRPKWAKRSSPRAGPRRLVDDAAQAQSRDRVDGAGGGRPGAGLVPTMLAAMPQEHERGLGGWQAEWTTLPELVELAGGATRAIADALEGLTVDVDRMRANLEITRGLALAEAVTMALAEHVGRSTAYTLVEQAARRATRDRGSLGRRARGGSGGDRHFSRAEINRRLAPETYLERHAVRRARPRPMDAGGEHAASVLPDKGEHGSIKDLRLLPICRVPHRSNEQRLRARHAIGDQIQRRRRRVEVGIARDQQHRRLDRLQRLERDLIPRRLRRLRRPRRTALALERKPALGTAGFAARYAGPSSRKSAGMIAKGLRPQPPPELEILLVLHADDAVRDHEAAQPRRERQRVVGRHDPACRGADDVEAIEMEVTGQRLEVIGGRRCWAAAVVTVRPKPRRSYAITRKPADVNAGS